MYLLLLRCASLLRHGGVYSLQSVPEAQSETASYRTEKGNTRTGHACWLWPDGRKRTDLHLSGNIQPHGGRVERMHISSRSDIRVTKINTPIFCSVYVFQQLFFMQCSVKKLWISEPTRKHNSMQIKFQYFIRCCLLCLYILPCHCVTSQATHIKCAL